MGLLGEKRSVALAVSGMHCGSCVGKVERALAAVPGVTRVSVDLAGAEAQVTFDPKKAEPAALESAVRGAGYEAKAKPGA